MMRRNASPEAGSAWQAKVTSGKGIEVAVAVGVGPTLVAVGVAVAVAVGPTLMAVGVAVAVAVGPALVAVAVAVATWTSVGVAVGVSVGTAVAVAVGVCAVALVVAVATGGMVPPLCEFRKIAGKNWV
jgi:hypothetical protein